MTRSLTAVLAAAIAASFGGPQSARAQCDDDVLRAPLEVTPSVGGSGVTIDAPIAVLYSPGYFGPEGPGDLPETLIRVGLCPTSARCGIGCDLDTDAAPVDGTVQVLGDRLFFLPDGGLQSSRVYVGTAQGIDRPLDFRFCTGVLADDGPPTPPTFQEARPDDSTATCDVPEGGRRIGLQFVPGTDDGAPGSIEYLLYLTRGHGVGAPELRDRVRNSSPDEVLLRLLLSREEASEPVCVRVYAVDGIGNVSEPSPEHCVDPQTAAAFQPLCSVQGGPGLLGRAAPRAGAMAPFLAAGGLLLLLASRARRRLLRRPR